MTRTAKNRIAGLISIIVLLFLSPTVAVFTAEDDLPVFTGNEYDNCIFGPDMECNTDTWLESDQSGVQAYCGDVGAGSQIVQPVVVYYKNTDVANAEFQNKIASINESIAYYDDGCPDDATCELLTSEVKSSEIGYLGYYTNYTYSEYYSGDYALLYGNYYASFNLYGFAEKMNEQEAREYYATAKECLKNIVMESEVTTTTPQQPCAIKEIYGEYSEETELLRYFRDNVLSSSSEGQEIIQLYYEWSPAIVETMKKDKAFKKKIKEMMDGVLPLIRGNH